MQPVTFQNPKQQRLLVLLRQREGMLRALRARTALILQNEDQPHSQSKENIGKVKEAGDKG